jgi:hypothetical protein
MKTILYRYSLLGYFSFLPYICATQAEHSDTYYIDDMQGFEYRHKQQEYPLSEKPRHSYIKGKVHDKFGAQCQSQRQPGQFILLKGYRYEDQDKEIE